MIRRKETKTEKNAIPTLCPFKTSAERKEVEVLKKLKKNLENKIANQPRKEQETKVLTEKNKDIEMALSSSAKRIRGVRSFKLFSYFMEKVILVE